MCAIQSQVMFLLLARGLSRVSSAADEGRIIFTSSYSTSGHGKTFEHFRLLRGGSYSRGGSSYHGGSSSWSSSSSRNHNSSNNGYHYNRNNNRRGYGRPSMGGILTGLAIAGFGLVILGLMLGPGTVGACLPLLCCCGAAGAGAAAVANANGSSHNRYVNEGYSSHNYYPNTNNNYSNNIDSNRYQFQNRVQQAKAEVENMSSHVHQHQSHSIQPFSGHYTTTFVDPESGKHHSASLCLFFTPDPNRNGYRIHGQGSDIDGSTVIEDGFANYDGNSWWIEKNITGDLSLQVLSRGTFNFRQQSFEGIWLANTMLSGPYLSFVAMSNANQAFNSNPIPTTSAQNAQNIPVVTGTVVSPPNPVVATSDHHVPVTTVVGTPV